MIVIGFIVLLTLGLLIYLCIMLAVLQGQLKQNFDTYADNLSEQLSYQLDMAQKGEVLAITQEIRRLQQDLYQQLTEIRDVVHQNLTDNRDRSDQRLEQINQQLNQAISSMQDSNEKRLEQIRQTVEEKLEQTLQSRLRASFDTVSKQLESVNQGLGEMRTVAKDVGTLNKVLSNTKTRGIMGELQLGQIVEDLLTPNQYQREFATVKGSSERVEYAIKLPGNQPDEPIYLPIDSKFPLEDYYRLEDAYEAGDSQQIESYRKALLSSIKRFAKDIRIKYVHPPETTNFGIMFLPTEGLYSEVVRNPSFFDALRREEAILVAGPSTLAALLNSLSVGFKTLSIQKNADDISKILGNVKTEFNKFGGMLTKAQKQLQTATKTVDSLLTTRTNAIIRALDTVEDYQDSATQSLLNLPQIEGEDSNEN